MAIPWGLLVLFGATGRAFEDQMGSSWAKPGAKCALDLSQNVSQNVRKSKAEIRSIFWADLGAYFGPKVMNLRCWLGCGMSFFIERGTLDFAYPCSVFEGFSGVEVPYMHPNSLANQCFCKALIWA